MIDLFQQRKVLTNQKRKHFLMHQSLSKKSKPDKAHSDKNPLFAQNIFHRRHLFNNYQEQLLILKSQNIPASLLRKSKLPSSQIGPGKNISQPFANILTSKSLQPAEHVVSMQNAYQNQQKSQKKRNQKFAWINSISSLQSQKKTIKDFSRAWEAQNPQQQNHNQSLGHASYTIFQQSSTKSIEPEGTPQILKSPQEIYALQKGSVQNSSLVNLGKKSHPTELSYRIRVKDRQKQIKVNQYEARKVIQMGSNTDVLTFWAPKANNNQELVRSILLGRGIWRELSPKEGIADLKWLFNKHNFKYKKQASFNNKKMVNHFEFNEQIATKDNLIKNLQLYCETKKLQIFSLTPVTFIIDFDDEYCEYNLKQFLTFYQKNDPRKEKNPPKKTNFSSSGSIISKLQPFMGWQNSDIKKKVNILSRPVNDQSYYSEGQNTYLWLLKPTGLNRGRGIQLFDSISKLQQTLLSFLFQMGRKKFCSSPSLLREPKKQKDRKIAVKAEEQLSKEDENVPGAGSNIATIKTKGENQKPNANCVRQSYRMNSCSFVIQKYIEKPFLIEGRKFDVRVWALLTHEMELFFFKEGYIRTSTENYSAENMEDYYIHLTNNAVQKNSENYGKFQKGNQLSFKALEAFIGREKVQEIWRRIKEITFMTFSAVRKKINCHNRSHCFQLFGLDFFISYDYKVWLIEVNDNPCLECSSIFLDQLVPRMLDDCFKLTVDRITNRRGEAKTYSVEGYSDKENLWQSLGLLAPNAQFFPQKQTKVQNSQNNQLPF